MPEYLQSDFFLYYFVLFLKYYTFVGEDAVEMSILIEIRGKVVMVTMK